VIISNGVMSVSSAVTTDVRCGTLFDRDNDIDECCLDVCFASNFEVLGKLTQHELKPGGAQILVTDENKEEYLK